MPPEQTDRLCSACGLRLHRYSPNHEGATDLMGCVNSLRGEVERLEGVTRAAGVVLDDCFDATKLSHLRLRDALARRRGVV